jgi:hypothetical protein
VSGIKLDKFTEIRDILFSSFNKHGLKYKVFGGTVMNFLEESRTTSDIDMAIQKNMGEVEKFIDALVDCGYADRQEILDGIFGADPHEEIFLFAMSRILPSSEEYYGFHIDLCFEFGSTTYESLETVPQNVNGITVDMAVLKQMLKMKEAIDPKRDRDIDDISVLRRRLLKDEN